MKRTEEEKAARKAARERNTREAIQHFHTLPDSAGVRLPVLCAVFACSAATVWRWTREGLLPEPRKLGPKVTTWPVAALREVLKRPSAPLDANVARAREVFAAKRGDERRSVIDTHNEKIAQGVSR
jgi:predicted DNA-binding transcriptional regulator AlpA